MTEDTKEPAKPVIPENHGHNNGPNQGAGQATQSPIVPVDDLPRLNPQYFTDAATAGGLRKSIVPKKSDLEK